ncbi:MAG: hypothetical protein Q9195_007273 [Heterodermia aff. obscurata]
MASHPLSASSNNPAASNATKPIPPRRLINEGIRNGSTEEIARALQLDRTLLPYALNTAVWRGSVPITTYLLNDEHAPVERLRVSSVLQEPTIELLDVLVSAGWDLNQRSPASGPGMVGRFLDGVAHDEGMVRWCLEHGAEVSDGKENEDEYRYRPLTDLAAGEATVSCFKMIRAHGAQLGRKTLHKAVKGAAWCPPENKLERMAMLEYLVNEERLDVNQLDTDDRLAGHPGTPIMYAIDRTGGADVVSWLLDHGANPKIKNSSEGLDALDLAERWENEEIKCVLRQWNEKSGER